jgi:AcrR family transcriptional regulator
MTMKSVTKRVRRKEARPAELMEAGLAAFLEHGFAATRMEDVARRAGAAKGTLFRYFPTKEALFEAAVASRAAPLWEGLPAPPEDAPLAEVAAALARRVHGALARPEVLGLLRIILTEGPRFPAVLEVWHRLSVSRARALLEARAAAAVARGELAPGPLATLPMALMAPALMAAVWQITFGAIEPVAPERFRDAHLDLLGRALRP